MSQPNRSRPIRIAILGAALSANRGAASMLQAVLDRVEEEIGPCDIDILTTYPYEDREALGSERPRILSARPRELVFPILPIAVAAFLLRVIHLPTRLACRTKTTRTLADADVVLDLAGISFSDGRGLATLAYNTIMTGIPLLIGTPIVKCAQALGPFNDRLNRTAARLVLPAVARIAARGPSSYSHAVGLGLMNVTEAGDLAFLMKTPPEARRHADDLAAGFRPYVAVGPSSVVNRYCRSIGIDYEGLMAGFIDWLIQGGHQVVMFPHSFRSNEAEDRMNDGPVCRRIHEALADRSKCLLLDRAMSAATLRAVIAGAEVLVTSRFHAMISGLATETPVMVVSWSHKYEEVMGAFELSDFVVPYQQLSLGSLQRRFGLLSDCSAEIRQREAAHLPEAEQMAWRNFDLLKQVVGSQGD
jgi:colanic acid/amylovoran biosynthesis protein